MTSPEGAPGGRGGGVRGNTFHGPTAILGGDHGTQHVQFVYQWKPAYRIEDVPTAPRPVSARMLAEQPSRLLRAVHEVVPFTGRHQDLDQLTRWRDDPAEALAVRLVHGPGGQGKTRLAAHFAALGRAAGWAVWQAVVNETGADPVTTSPPSETGTGTGVLLVVDYAERWPTPDLRRLLQDPLLSRTGTPVRVLLLARPAGIWWESLETWIGDTLDAPAEAHALRPLAGDPTARAVLFRQARDRFAGHLGLPADRAGRILPPPDLDTDEDYTQILTIHIAALAAVDAHLHDDPAPVDPARASAYLLKRERAHWGTLPLSTTPQAMGRTVLTATLTRPLARTHGATALVRAGLADSPAAANTLLDDHRHCYPPAHADPARTVTVLEPLYPDRLGEDFLGLTTPAAPDVPHPVPGAITDDWAHGVAERLLLADADTSTPAPWTRDTLTVLIETARRWPHIATGQLHPLLRKHPELALHAGGNALATLASLDTTDITLLEAIEPHFPQRRHVDLDIGIAAVTKCLADHRLATHQDPAARARTYEILAIRQSRVGLHDEAVTAGREAVRAWRDLAGADPARQVDLARSLSNFGAWLVDVGRREEALTACAEAVEIWRGLAPGDPEYGPSLASSLSNLGALFWEVGRQDEALTACAEAVEIWRGLAPGDPARREPDFAASLSNFGVLLWDAGREDEALTVLHEAVGIRRGLMSRDPAAYAPALATSLCNFGPLLSDAGREDEALTVLQEAVGIRRGLATGNPAAYAPDLAVALSNLGTALFRVGRREEALATTQEAVEMFRRLTAANPAAYGPGFATALYVWAAARYETRQNLAEALRATGEAVETYRKLVSAAPARFLSPLVNVLNLQADLLLGLGRLREAQSIRGWLAALSEPERR
ncbi:tetratricopeptide repeat protein [Streptomyces sp. NPDC006314]|uniref:tetratricopeptide repeat protein n=1 Tax=Streptomyces sp. NPDC006314 TaxID=3154475 RepID=UPI0033B52D32